MNQPNQLKTFVVVTVQGDYFEYGAFEREDAIRCAIRSGRYIDRVISPEQYERETGFKMAGIFTK